jgi:hypothetical protein
MVVTAYLISKKVPLDIAYQAVYNIRASTYLSTVQKKGLYDFYKKVLLAK